MAKRMDYSAQVFTFGRHRVVPSRRELLEDGVPVELGGRAFDLLLALIDGQGKVVKNEQLMNRVWPGRVVEDNSLHAHVSALRKALGDSRHLIRTVSGRGYQFVGEVQAAAAEVFVVSEASQAPTNLPERVSELIGREEIVAELIDVVKEHRLLTLVGTGGIGKTRLALEIGRSVLDRFPDGVWLAELGSLSQPDLIAGTVAQVLGVMPVNGVLTDERIAQAIRGRTLLLVLDNCEHVIEGVARLVEQMLRASNSVSIIATSREPLLVDAEYVYRVPPLDVPEEGAAEDDEAYNAGALRLFVARIRTSDPAFVPDPTFIATAAAVCRSLDGIPLAIELAAVRCTALGIDELAARLSDRFRFLSGGRRTALPRHQTLQATFDWSFDLLLEVERLTFRRLAVFVGSFSLAAATAVVAGDGVDEEEVPDHLGQLVAKSLVVSNVAKGRVTYRLLETTRAYALQRLSQAGEFPARAATHGGYYLDALRRAAPEFESLPARSWRIVSDRDIDNIRAALDWAHSPAGDPGTAEELTAVTVPLWTHLSLINECLARVKDALRLRGPGAEREGRRQHIDMRLQAALGAALVYTDLGPEARVAWTHALRIAEALDDGDYQLRALWGLWMDHLNCGEYRQSLQPAERFLVVASSAPDPNAPWLGHRLIGISLHFLGEQTQAAVHLERVLTRYVSPHNLSHIIRYQFDPRLTASCFQARIRWLQGFPEQAMRIIETTIEEAQSLGHALSLVHTLGQGACMVSLLSGNLVAARHYATLLDEHASKHGITLWQAWSRCFAGAIRVRSGDLDGGLRILRSEFTDQPGARRLPRYMYLLCELASALASAGEFPEAKVVIAEALERAGQGEERWYLSELTRVKGMIALLEGAEGAEGVADACFASALEIARSQHVLSLELRATISIARLREAQGRAEEGRLPLLSVIRRFTEGHRTTDQSEARLLLDRLSAVRPQEPSGPEPGPRVQGRD